MAADAAIPPADHHIPASAEQRRAKFTISAITLAWCAAVLLPLLALVGVSVATTRGLTIIWSFSLAEYESIFGGFRWEVILRTFRLTAFVTLIEFLLAFPFALWLAKRLRNGWFKTIVLVLLVVPFFLSAAARTIVWRAILGREGLVNSVLMSAGITDAPLDWMLFSEFAVVIGLIGPYFPSMVWPLFISISLIDDELINASRDLGASEWQTLTGVIMPLAAPGIVAGVIFTAVPMLGDNVSAALLGGGNVALVAESITAMVGSLDFTGASAMATVVFASVALVLFLVWLMLRRSQTFNNVFTSMKQ